jgi:hypothetical protein
MSLLGQAVDLSLGRDFGHRSSLPMLDWSAESGSSWKTKTRFGLAQLTDPTGSTDVQVIEWAAQCLPPEHLAVCAIDATE